MAGYATIYTMAPVFSLVLDRDVNEDLALIYPELYKDLTKVVVSHCRPCLRLDACLVSRAECYLTRRSSCGS